MVTGFVAIEQLPAEDDAADMLEGSVGQIGA
jgi:hypothetical protein